MADTKPEVKKEEDKTDASAAPVEKKKLPQLGALEDDDEFEVRRVGVGVLTAGVPGIRWVVGEEWWGGDSSEASWNCCGGGGWPVTAGC